MNYDLCRMICPTLKTERLVLRPLRIDDIDLLVDLDSDPEVMRYITDGKPQTKEHYEKRIPELLKYMQKHPGLGLWPTYLKETNEFIGWYILKHLPDGGEVEVGFRIKKKFWGNGYSTEAGKALLKHGFETLGLKKIAAIVRPDNFASQAVIKKIGLKEKGTGTWYGIECLYFEVENQF
ncbi:MAG: GNAT family N-acetyltransferase [Flavobacteriales bacterium]|nr:GNAT family N-acetyltransferase [Flavobacteriales bacterium]